MMEFLWKIVRGDYDAESLFSPADGGIKNHEDMKRDARDLFADLFAE